MKKLIVKDENNVQIHSSIWPDEQSAQQFYDNNYFLNEAYEIVDGEVAPVPVSLETQEQLESRLAQSYLNSTDWYTARFVETGVEIPQEIKDQRAAARLKVIN